MKKILITLFLISIFSCNENKVIAQENKIDELNIDENLIEGIQEIENLYQPEKMSIKQNKFRTDNKKENYEIILTNSDYLDSISQNLELDAKKIANLYFKNLVRNIVPLNFKKITVKIEHRNGKKDSFKYSERDFQKNPIEFLLNTKFTIRVTKINESQFKYSILKTEAIEQKLKLWNNENLFNENGEKETIEIYFGETESKYFTLIMKSKSKYSIKFKSEIQTEEDGEFIEIQNVGTHNGSITTESWAKKTIKIKLSEFELKK